MKNKAIIDECNVLKPFKIELQANKNKRSSAGALHCFSPFI